MIERFQSIAQDQSVVRLTIEVQHLENLSKVMPVLIEVEEEIVVMPTATREMETETIAECLNQTEEIMVM